MASAEFEPVRVGLHGGGGMGPHEYRIRDLRERFGASEVFAASCACGWLGPEQTGREGERRALEDWRRHARTAASEASPELAPRAFLRGSDR
jgi:hypothetical protein